LTRSHKPKIEITHGMADFCPKTIAWPLKMRLRGYSEMSVRSYHYLLRNNPEERSSHLLRGRRLKSRNLEILHHVRITCAPTYSNHFQTAVVNKSLSNIQASESARFVTENLSLVLMPLYGYM